jgi:hypothetical protein
MKHLNQVVVGLCILVACMSSGCQGSTKTGTKYTQLPDRSLQANLSGSMETVHSRAVAVLKDDFHYVIVKDKHDAQEGIIEARTARDNTVTVETFRQGDNVTKVRVNAGFLKSTDHAEESLDKIESSLPSAK